MLITDIINILGNEFSSIYCVNRQDQYIQIYRHLNENTELDELMNEKKTYETVIQKYIETNVFEEDRNKMLVATDFNNICKQLQLVSQFTIHYRIKNGNDIASVQVGGDAAHIDGHLNINDILNAYDATVKSGGVVR